MSEKRFRKVRGFIRDNTLKGSDVERVMDLTEVEGMLNSLSEENEKLKEEVERLQKFLVSEVSNTQYTYDDSEYKTLNKIRLYDGSIILERDALLRENEQLRKIGVMYQGHNPCETCTYCLEDKVCCAEPVLICDDAKENFVQGLCKNHKQIVKSNRRYDDE